MKKIINVLCLLLILVGGVCVLAGCEKKENESKKSESSSNPIVGKWTYNDSYTYSFKDDGTGTYDTGKMMSFTYKINGNRISILYEGNTVPFETEFSIKDDVLNIKDSFGNDTLYKKK